MTTYVAFEHLFLFRAKYIYVQTFTFKHRVNINLLKQDRVPKRMPNPILVVEDNKDLSLLFRLSLESAGYQVKTVDNGNDALKHIDAIQPQLVLLDIMMPEISGLEVARKIKQRENYECLPILLTSALDRLQDDRLHESQADGILYKPFDIDELIQRVDSLIA